MANIYSDRDELKKYNDSLRRDTERIFRKRTKYPNRYYIVSKDPSYPYKVIENGKDVTPRPKPIPGEKYLTDEELVNSLNEISDLTYKVFEEEMEIPEPNLNYDDLDEIIMKYSHLERYDVWYSPEQLEEWEEKKRLEKVPSMFRLREDPQIKEVEDTQYTIKLRETETFYLLDIGSHLAPIESDVGNEFIKSIERFKEADMKKQFLVIEPYCDSFTQKFGPIVRNQFTVIKAATRENAGVDVFEYDRNKTYMSLGVIDRHPRFKSSRMSSLFIPAVSHSHDSIKSKKQMLEKNLLEKIKPVPKEQEMVESIEFLYASTVLGRILSANVYSDVQSLFHERLYSKKAVEDFKYLPQLLWTSSFSRTNGKPVTSISWSSINPELFLVSYGKYLFDTKADDEGLVCLWNVINTEFPERVCILKSPVTYARFSKKYPRIVAVTFWNGTSGLLDMALKEPEFLVQSEEKVGGFRPLWQIKWFFYDDEEILLTCGEKGEIHSFEIDRKFKSKKLLTVRRIGNVVRKGIDVMPQVNPNYSQTEVTPSIRVIAQYPKEEDVLFVGTEEGYVYVYSISSPDEPLDAFGAHFGTITAIKFNPVDCRIFLTAGWDGYIRIWGYSIYDTYLIQLKNNSDYGIDDAVWCPAHPYIIISAYNVYIDVWNIKRKYFEPVNTVENPNNIRNLVLSFNPTGANFLVGDMNGDVHVYGVSSIPKPPEDPLKKLAEAILFPLSNNHQRLKLMVLKLGEPFVPDQKKIKEIFSVKKPN